MTSSTARVEPDAIPQPASAAPVAVPTAAAPAAAPPASTAPASAEPTEIRSTPTAPTPAAPTSFEPIAETAAEPVPTVPVPQDQAGIDALRLQIDSIDAELVQLIQRRTAISHAIGTARKTLGGPRIVYSREMAILERFRSLGPAGTDLGMMLLSMGRGRLGRK